MRYLCIGLLLALLFSGCGGWGDYVHKSDRFKFKFTFPQKWEVWDRSDDERDYLVASLLDGPREAKIVVIADPVAPDISPNEIYPSFMDGGGDGAILTEFSVEGKGAISCKNGEGRYVRVSYLTEEYRINGMRVLFLGNRFKLQIDVEMPADDFVMHETEFFKMISLMEL